MNHPTPITIEIAEYQPTWPSEFQSIAATLRIALGNAALRIDHIGSTAVPNLCAKDIIDVQVTVAELNDCIAEAISEAGFERRAHITRDHVPPSAAGNAGYENADDDCDADNSNHSHHKVKAWQKLFFVQPIGQRRMNIHIRKQGAPNQRYPLLFRDYLIAHPHVAAAYGELKRRLASNLAKVDTYPDVKDPAVDLIYFAADDWAKRELWTLPKSS